MTTLCPAPFDHISSLWRGHSLHKTMSSLAPKVAWLECNGHGAISPLWIEGAGAPLITIVSVRTGSGRRDQFNLEVGLDFLSQPDGNNTMSEFLYGALEMDLFAIKMNLVFLQPVDNILSRYRTE